MKRLKQLRLTTERLLIRPVEQADLEQIYLIHCDAEVNQYLPYETWQSFADAQDWFEYVEQRRRDSIAEQFVLLRLTDHRVVGTCLAFNYNDSDRRLEFGYVLAQAYWGNGYMQEAMEAFIPALALAFDLQSLRASVESDNLASLKLLEKFGFEHRRTVIEKSGVHLLLLRKTFDSKTPL